MSAPPAPNFITKALEAAMLRDPEARWSDTTIFAQAVWDALLAEGTLRWLADCPSQDMAHLYETSSPHLPQQRVLVVPLMEGEAKPHA